MTKQLIFLFIVIFFRTPLTFSQEKGSFTDPRDNAVYKTVTLNIPLEGGITVKRKWMAENLRYEVNNSFCYKNEPAYCEVYGRLYTFMAAMEACPPGWRIPTIADWNLIFQSYGGLKNAGLAIQKGGESGLDLMVGGFGDPANVFKNIGISGNYWDAERRSSNISGLISIQKDTKEIYHSIIGNWHRNSCRCIEDY